MVLSSPDCYMKISKLLLERTFKEFNSQYFNNELPTPKFQVYYGNKSTGHLFHNRDNEGKLCSVKLGIAWNREWTEEWFKHVMLHEMVHLKVAFDGYDKPGHGKEFRKRCKIIKDRFGINPYRYKIPVPYDKGTIMLKNKEKKQKGILCRIIEFPFVICSYFADFISSLIYRYHLCRC